MVNLVTWSPADPIKSQESCIKYLFVQIPDKPTYTV